MNSATASRNNAKKIDSSSDNNRAQNGQAKSQTTAPVKAQATKSGASALPTPTPGKEAAVQSGKEISFHFDAPSAKTVLLAGEFTAWDKTPIKMIKGGGGTWHTKVTLAPGRHLYRFLVDGEWQNDPVQHERVPNSFGSFNNVVEIR